MMGLRDILFVLFLWCLYSTLDAARGRTIEDLELEEELKRFNKPAVEIIQTKYGDMYGCVDFYEQPAFDHPLLMDHKYNYKMPEKRINKISSDLLNPKNIWINGKGCPNGTVPIKRLTKDDLTRAKQAADIYGSNYNPQTVTNPGVHYAVVHTTDTYPRMTGAAMHTSLYNPQVQDNQFSGSHMLIRNGVDSIEVGWIVHPSLYKDNKTRLFIYTNSKEGSCFNTYCPGFIYVNAEVPLDVVFTQTTIRGQHIRETKFFIYKDEANGDWFLTLANNVQLGSWPSRIFDSLSDTATYVEWGGETYSPPGVPSPPMGASFFELKRNTGYDAYCSMIEVEDENHKLLLAEHLKPYTDAKPWYLVENTGKVRADYGNLVLYGGAGGYTKE